MSGNPFWTSSVFWWAAGFMLAATVLRVATAIGQTYRWEQVQLSSFKANFRGLFLALLGGGLLTWLLVTDSIRDFGTSLYDNLRVILMHDWGLTEAQIGLYFSLFALVYVLVSLVGSRLADRWSAAGSMALGGLIEAGSLIILVLFPVASTFTIYLVLTGIG